VGGSVATKVNRDMDGLETTNEPTPRSDDNQIAEAAYLDLINVVQNDKQIAEEAYLDLINVVQKAVPASDLLFGTSDKASYYRGLLIDRPIADGGATYDELWTARIEGDVAWLGLESFDLSTGRLQKKELPVYQSDNDIIQRLWESLSVTLDSSDEGDLWRFMYSRNDTGRVPCEGVIRALFNIPKNASPLNKRLGHCIPPYATRKKLVEFCVSQCKPEGGGPSRGTRVTTAMAKKARDRICSIEDDPTGSKRKIIDLSEYTVGFGDRLKKKMEEGGLFLDVVGGVTSKNDPTIATSPRPVVATHVVGEVGGSFTPFWVVTIHNPFTLSFVDRWHRDMNKLLFTSGRHGKIGAYIRNASSTAEPAPFTIGGRTVYGGQHLSDFEKSGVLYLANFVADYQRETIEATLGTHYVVTFHANLLHTVVNAIVDALYGFHSDSDPQVCSDSIPKDKKRIHVEDVFHLPTNCEQQVITMGSSNSPAEFSTILEYEKIGQQGSLASLKLGGCFLHIQGPGSQQPGIRHQVRMTPDATKRNNGTVWRFHCTSRLVLCPKQKKDDFEIRMKKNLNGTLLQPCDYHSSDYKHQGVLSKCIDYQVENHSEHEVANVQEESPNKRRRIHPAVSNGLAVGQRFDLLSPENTDRFQQLPRSDFDSLCIFRPLPTMLYEGSMLSHLSSAPMTKFLFNHGYIVNSIGSNGSGKREMIPRLHQVPAINSTGAEDGATRHPIPGTKYKLSRICLDAGMRHSRRAHPMLCPNEETHSPIIIITRAYKNDWKTVHAHLQALKEWSEDRSKPLYNEKFDGKLTVYGSGGAPEILGAHPPDFSRDTKLDPQVLIPSAQPFESSKINQALVRLMLDNHCVAIYVNEDEMFGGVEADTEAAPSCSFLGYFSCGSLAIDRKAAAVVHALYKDSNQQTQMHAQFQQVPHFRLDLVPVFTNEDLLIMLGESNIATDYKILAVEHDCQDKITVDIPFGGAEAALAGLDRSQMYDSFIANKEYMRYLQNPDNSAENPDDSAESHDDDRDEDDDDRDEDAEELIVSPAALPRATIPQLVDACLINNAAGAFRAMKRNITTLAEGKEVAGPLMIETLPVICRLQSTPMSNRALDVVCLFLRRDCKDGGLFRRTCTVEGQRIVYKDDWKSDLVDVAFKAILLRFTGRINAFRNYSLHEKTSPMIPIVKDLGGFLTFMEKSVKGTRLGQWHSKQHLQAIPASVQHYESFAEFITEVGKTLPEVITNILSNQKQGEQSRDTRKEAVTALKAMLSSCCNGDTSDGLHFLAQIVVADIDEIFEDVFGETRCNGMIAGHGGAAGIALLGTDLGKKGLPAILSLIIDYVQTEVSDEHLAIAGYHKDSAGIVFNSLNGRPFNASDAEHFLCKGSVLAKLTLGHYRNSKYPVSAKPWCHPIKLTKEKEPYDTFTYGIMKTIVDSYTKCTSAASLVIPEVCYLPNEELERAARQLEEREARQVSA
jgi:hypothetical protein